MSSQIRIYRSPQEIPTNFGPSALTVGNFDGVHIGHREIFRRIVRVGREHDWKPSALTFDPHPTEVVAPERAPRLLSTPEERCRWMEEEGIEQAVILPFTRRFSRLSPEQFCHRYLKERLQAKAVMIGANFRFGYGHAGDTGSLERLGERYGFLTEIVPSVHYRGRLVSSSEVRRLISAGDVSTANRMLNRAYTISGEVVPGRGIGSTRTVPTLNLRPEARLLPGIGVYVTRTTDPDSGARWSSVTNIGRRPTFHNGDEITIETHLLDPLVTGRPRRIEVAFLRKLRTERRYPDAGSLKQQILRDAARAQSWHRRAGKWVGEAACRGRATGRANR